MTTYWIGTNRETEEKGVVFYKKTFAAKSKVKKAELSMTACGVYHAEINGKTVGYPLAPGYDCYIDRIQMQTYDVTSVLKEKNEIRVGVGAGWYGWYHWDCDRKFLSGRRALTCELNIEYEDGTLESIRSDEAWTVCKSGVFFADIYDGEKKDARINDYDEENAVLLKNCRQNVVPADTDPIVEQEVFHPIEIVTSKGERVLDFGQNVSGYVQFKIKAKAGDRIVYSHGEILDKDGCFYNANYRSAKASVEYTCKDGEQFYKPTLTFFGFRYIRLDECPDYVTADCFSAVAIYTKLDRRGYISSSDTLLNKLFSNIIWGQKDNFVDIPTDCPQRDERLGWTGDAQVFCRTANYNFDCEKFFKHYLRLINVEQKRLGIVNIFVPDSRNYHSQLASGWADAITIMNRDLYDFYGDKEFLREEFPYMKMHVDSITSSTTEPYLWRTDRNNHFGDWLGIDAEPGSYIGKSRIDYISTAFYACSTQIVVSAGKELGEDVSGYERLLKNIKTKFNEVFPEPETQTECSLAVCFDLYENKEKTGDLLVKLIKDCGNHLQTGFLGTPYILYALTQTGHVDVAYELLLREEYPSWLYSVRLGATTIWEHFDGINDKGELWSADMNSFNHYAYGSVGGWIYSVAAGITPLEKGFKKVRVAPNPSDRLDWLEARYMTDNGEIVSKWYHENGRIRYEITLPVSGEIVVDGKTYVCEKGKYLF